MYVPRHFELTDRAGIDQRLEEDSFAMLVTVIDGQPFATHLPLLAKRDGEQLILRGHVARANPHWKSFTAETESLAVFSGPHCYISPRWYAAKGLVPTWNYEAIHAYGPVRVLEEASDVRQLLDDLTAKFEADAPEPWTTEGAMDDKALFAMMRGIVGFEMTVTRLEAKSKMGQNRGADDVQGAAKALDSSPREMDRAVAGLMRARFSD
ncbi:FMN-binding negative transcriptional regulator [Alphaproteobacteria bacterium HT1-32]|nr:FMN-binding negative transcriptional regulator [Alphaproteobacteria bacterium HT1-32]